ncbi:MAG: Coenzyme F420 hydrogenase/dehydrogenase, beta subunit C-terminal domain [Acidaminococcaceae bacterium]|nr:Coenzyme F420 hydrogenase/dehydrogenase, beta subunit C-terminal domain [Acidaminococcaceae bacterium]
MIELFKEKIECCGCAACMNICPELAITMKTDENGFIYPNINADLCIECGLCLKTCAYQNIPSTANKPFGTYVAVNKNKTVLLNSSSGGIFAALASIIFEKKGVVFGCAFNENMEPKHICVDNSSDLKTIQGSKYVQSNIATTYTEVKHFLQQGKFVLYTGTPCQIAGIKSYLGKGYDNLITADIICHGVSSEAFFKGYIKHLEEKLKGKVIDFKFRDKSRGWGLRGKVVFEKNGALREKFIEPIESYYYKYFLVGDIYRENCYECKYANGRRQGDLTMGDYWGIEKFHPVIETQNGVSVLLVNSSKGMALLPKLGNYLDLTSSTFEQARAENEQLRQPTSKSKNREVILKTWREGGYRAVADKYNKENKRQLMMFRIRRFIPIPIKELIKSVINK